MNPSSWTRRRWAMLAAIPLVPLACLVIAYALFLRGSNVAPLSVRPATATHAAAAVSTLSGDWIIGSGSTAGYRVHERLARLPAASDAVGRTTAITGRATFTAAGSQASLAAATFTADVSKLTSDQAMRDRRLHSIGLESDRFPTATFVLTTPLAVPDAALTGATAHVSITGRLTLHGVTKVETFKVDVQQAGSNIEAVGSLTFPWDEFGMTPPNIGSFVTVESNPVLEFKLVLHPASAVGG